MEEVAARVVTQTEHRRETQRGGRDQPNHMLVGVVLNSLQDIGRASDRAEWRPVAGGLGRSVAESEAGPSGLAPVLGGCGGRSPRGTVQIGRAHV